MLIRDRIRQKEALVSCFMCLQDKGDHLLRPAFSDLMSCIYQYNPKKEKVIQELFSRLDPQQSNQLTLNQFCQVLPLMQSQQCFAQHLLPTPVCWDTFRTWCKRTLRIKRIVKSNAFLLLFVFFAVLSSVFAVY